MTAPGMAVILFAHGSRDPLWSRPIEAIAARMAALQPATPVCCAYLELMSPDLATAAQGLVAGGARYIRVVPMFLGVGKHARHDLPELLQTMSERYPDVHFDLQPAIGEQPQVVDLMARVALQS